MYTERNFPKPEPAKNEWRWVLVFAILVMVVTTIPYFIGYQKSGGDWVFTGFVINLEDSNNYIAKMLRGTYGDWLFRTPYTAPPREPVIAYSFYTLLGKLASPPAAHIQLVAIFHLARVISGVLAIIAMYGFTAIYIGKLQIRRYVILLVSLGGGLGWLAAILSGGEILNSLPIGFYSPEAFSFLMLFGLPHLCLARALLFWGLTSYLRFVDGSPVRGYWPAVRIGLLWLLLGLLQPVTVVLGWALIWLHSAVDILVVTRKERSTIISMIKKYRQKITGLLLIVLFSSPVVVYIFVLYAFPGLGPSWFYQVWGNQVQVLAPRPVHYLIAYGLVLSVIIYFGVKRYYRLESKTLFLFCWLLALPAFLYAPTNVQRRLAEGAWVGIVALAAVGIEQIQARTRRYLTIGVLALSLPTTIFLLAGGVSTALDLQEPAFIRTDLVDVYEYLSTVSDRDDVILSSYEAGNSLPAWSPNFVVVGHGPETVDFHNVMEEVRNFYEADAQDELRLDLIERYSIDYILWGEHEREYGDWNPSEAEYMDMIYANDTVTLFEVSIP